MRMGHEILFSIFSFFKTTQKLEMGGWNYIYLLQTTCILVAKEDFLFIIPMYYEKTNVVCNDQNILERAILMNTNGICLYRAEGS